MSLEGRGFGSIRRWFRAAALAAGLLLAGCGGGGGGGGGSTYSLSVTPESLTFTADQGRLPAAQTLTVGFNGDGLLAGWPAGTTPPGWLSIRKVSNTASSAVLEISVTVSSLPPGTARATVRLATGKADLSDGVIRDVPVTFTVTPSALSVVEIPSTTLTEASSTADLDRPFTVKTGLTAAAGAACSWQVRSDRPWLTVTPSTGTLAADTPVVAHLDPEALWTMANGSYLAYLGFTLGAGCGRAAPPPVPVAITLALRPALSLGSSVAFTITDTSLPADARRTIALGSNVGSAFAAHARWTATLDDDWVTVLTTAGTGAATLTLDLAPATIGSIAAGHHATTLYVVPADRKLAAPSAPVTLDLDIPTIAQVAPYTNWVNRASPVILRGGGFGSGPTRAIKVGDASLDATVVSSTELHVTIPAQAAPVRLPVRIETATPRDTAELVVLPEPAYAATTIALDHAYEGMALDPERRAVLLTGYWARRLTRLRFDGSAWQTDHLPVADASGVGVAANGREILVVSGRNDGVSTRYGVVRLDPETLSSRATASFTDTYAYYGFVAPLDDGRTLLVNTYSWATLRWYPGFAQGPTANVSSPRVLLTRDRRRLLMRPWDNSSASSSISSLASTGAAFQRGNHPSAYFPASWDVSGDGGRMVDGLDVYDPSFTKLGTIALPAPEPQASAISPDGASVYALQKVSGAWALRRTDVSAAAGPYTPDAAPLPFVLPPDQVPSSMRVSEDGSTLFILATRLSADVGWLHVVRVR
jgi:hypothetical protein